MDRTIREFCFKLFNREIFNYEELPFDLKKHLHELYLNKLNFYQKLDLLGEIGNDDQISRINSAFTSAINDDKDFSYLGASLIGAIRDRLDEILVDRFNEALEDWNLRNLNDELKRGPSENDLNMASYNRERMYGGF